VDDAGQGPFWAVFGAIAVGLGAMAVIARRRGARR
jgi:hypothetical protein